MARFPWISRRIVIGLVVCALTLAGSLLQPPGALARSGSSGEHYKEVAITSIELIAPVPIPYPNDGPSWNWWCRSWWCR